MAGTRCGRVGGLLCLLRLGALALAAAFVAACGSSENVSPGSVVVEVPVEGGGSDGGSGDDDDGDDDGSGGGTATASAIPSALSDVIADSGETAGARFDGKPIYTIDVGATANGAIDPEGLVLGNDAIYEIVGGAARITPPDGSAASSGGALPDCRITLAPGAVVVGATNEDFLVVERGCAIVADGTAEQPILFTAKAEVLGNAEDGDRGLWGGLVVNGYAPINDCPEGAAGGSDDCVKEGEANSGLFGGSNANDNSGTLRYVSVRFAGANVDPENQLNGIAFQAVGDATTLEYVQVHNNLDDGIEFFGGTVNAKYVALTGNADDSLGLDRRLDRSNSIPLHRTDGFGGQRHRSGQPRRRRRRAAAFQPGHRQHDGAWQVRRARPAHPARHRPRAAQQLHRRFAALSARGRREPRPARQRPHHRRRQLRLRADPRPGRPTAPWRTIWPAP